MKHERSEIFEALRNMIALLGDDPTREGLQDTPARFLRGMMEMCSGYETPNPEDILKTFLVECDTDEMILVRDIEYTSLCEHHLLPFTGVAHVAYIPAKRIVGLSKIPRVVDAYSRRLQVQERLSYQVAQCMNRALKPKGVGVVTVGKHSCMSCRGVRKGKAEMVCSSLTGAFKKSQSTRAELFNLIKGV